ncbi:hypothetical protein F4859DRAFT_308421 [Xylaria cf. heliscus]|nr:hypothetical protein F4859DRAFT_308421 [Xylaria cf. heliscus]
MEDVRKPGMLDPIDDIDLLKKPTNTEAQAYCATVISNLEGWRCWGLPSGKEGRGLTIAHLDTRIRRLESVDNINPPPPMDMPSWDSLMWRVARLHRKMPQGGLSISRLTATPPPIQASADLLRTTVASIGGAGPQSWAAFAAESEETLDGDDDDLVRAAAQFLCYLAGRRGHKHVGTFNLATNCALALNLSLDADANAGYYVGNAFHVVGGGGGGPRPRHHGVMGAAVMPPLAAKKLCCGCCGCYCHKDDEVKPSVQRWMTGKYYEEKRANRTGFKGRIARAFRKLAFWRRRRLGTDSDASSISTRSSSTFT